MNSESNNSANTQEEPVNRKRRVKRLKLLIIVGTLVLILIPILLCFGMFVKIKRLEKKIETIVLNEQLQQSVLVDEEPDRSSVIYAKDLDTETESDGKASLQAKEKNNDKTKKSDPEEDLVLTKEERLELKTEKKKVYLTFDDGPSRYTDELLDILKKNKIKATFFVVGRTDKRSLAVYQRIVDEGHTLAMHSYSHQYSKIYKSIRAFEADFNQLSDLLYETTGVRPTMYRFPGGSSNLVSDLPMTKFIKYLNNKDITYYDWNATNGDATGKKLTQNQMIDNVMNGVRQNNNSMVLMHDSVARDTTVKSLPSLIKKLKKEGYVILPITQYTKTIQHIKADSVE